MNAPAFRRSDEARRSNVIKKSALKMRATPVRLGENAEPAGPEAEPLAEPIVTTRKSGDLLEAVEVTCTCGRHMVIECLYDARSPESPS